MRSSRFLLPILILVACGPPSPGNGPTAPSRTTVRLSEFGTGEMFTEGDEAVASFPVPPADIWAILPEVYGLLDIPVAESNPTLMTLGNPGYRTRQIEGTRMGSYLDCGTTRSGVLANVFDVTLTISTHVASGSDGGAVVKTNIDAWAKPRMTNGNPVHCRTKKRLEERLAELVAEVLAGRIGGANNHDPGSRS